MSKISKDIKEKIARRAATKFAEKTKIKLAKEEEKLALQCYNHIYSKKERDIIATVPDGWLRKCKCLKFNIAGWTVTLTAKEEMPTKQQDYCKPLGVVEAGDLADKVQAHATAKKKADEDLSAFYHKILSMLLGVSTWKKLQETWKEGTEFYKDLIPAENTGANVPAVLVADINKALGLKS